MGELIDTLVLLILGQNEGDSFDFRIRITKEDVPLHITIQATAWMVTVKAACLYMEPIFSAQRGLTMHSLNSQTQKGVFKALIEEVCARVIKEAEAKGWDPTTLN